MWMSFSEMKIMHMYTSAQNIYEKMTKNWQISITEEKLPKKVFYAKVIIKWLLIGNLIDL